MTKDPYTFTYGGREYRIPESMHHGLEHYIQYGIPGGGFLSAIFENNLVRAAGAADVWNMPALPAYANYLYNHMPSDAWGSADKVAHWVQKGGLRGRDPKDQ